MTACYRVFVIAMLACFLSAIALAQKVNVDWERTNNFSKYKTYAWAPSPNAIKDPMWNQRVMEDVDAALASKGLLKVQPDANPDLLVSYSAGVHQNVSWEGYRDGLVMGMGSIQQQVQNEGILIVDLADPTQKMVVWRAMSEDALKDKSDKNIKELQKMVHKMFEKYPPK